MSTPRDIEQPIIPAFEEYIRQGDVTQRERAENWQVAIGLQAVDNLHVSDYLRQTAEEHIAGNITQEEVEGRIAAYYKTEEGRKEETDTDEADMVSARIVKALSRKSFTLSPSYYAAIHKELFSGILPYAGTYRDFNITKKEWVLDNDTVLYGDADYISQTLQYDFGEEKKFAYRGLTPKDIVAHFAAFIAGIWQIHPFREGNTRTTAVFAILYLRQLGYKVDNSPFKTHSWYFRNALVRANYHNVTKGIDYNPLYLERFFRNIILGEKNELKNRYCHILWKEDEIKSTLQSTLQNTLKGTPKRICEMLAQNPTLTISEVAEQLNLNRRGVAKHFANLQAKGILYRVGPDKSGHWEVNSLGIRKG